MAPKKKKTQIEKQTKKKLTPKRELFCQLYASDREFFGNGAQSYLEAYDSEITYKAARTCAYRLLTNVDILARIDELMDIYINDQVVDKELAFVIQQKGDLGSKVAAIREYNKLKGRIREKGDIELTQPRVINNTLVFIGREYEEKAKQALLDKLQNDQNKEVPSSQ